MMHQIHFSRQRAQLSNLGKQLLKLHNQGKAIPKKILYRFKQLCKKLLPHLGTNGLVKAIGCASLLILPYSAVPAQTPNYAPAVINPFGLDATILNETYYNQPAFADLDDDGDLDLLAIFESYVQGNGDSVRLHYYENIGNEVNPQFATPSINPFNFESFAGYIRSVELVDVDGDGDLDIVLAGYVDDLNPQGDSELYVMVNDGDSISPSFLPPANDILTPTLPVQDPGALFPTFGDLDDDGDIDLLFDVYDSQNYSVTTVFQENGAPNGGIILGPGQVFPFNLGNLTFDGTVAIQDLADIDQDGDLDLLSTGITTVNQSTYEGSIVFYENIGTSSQAMFSTPVASPFNLPIYTLTDEYMRFKAVDIDGDLDHDIFVLLNGQLLFFENSPISSTEEVTQLNFKLFPNPTNGLIEINTDERIDQIQLLNSLGTILKTISVNSDSIELNDQPPGIYLVKAITTDNRMQIFKVIKQ